MHMTEAPDLDTELEGDPSTQGILDEESDIQPDRDYGCPLAGRQCG